MTVDKPRRIPYIDTLLLNKSGAYRGSSFKENVVAQETEHPGVVKLKTPNAKLIYLSVAEDVLYLTTRCMAYDFDLTWESERKETDIGLERIVLNNFSDEYYDVINKHLQITKDLELKPITGDEAVSLYSKAILAYLEDIVPRYTPPKFEDLRD